MAETTPFTIGADASCADGGLRQGDPGSGRPVARAVTHLVVDRHGKARLVPLDLVGAAGGEIRLRCTRAEFNKLQLAETRQFLPVSGGGADLGYGRDRCCGPTTARAARA